MSYRYSTRADAGSQGNSHTSNTSVMMLCPDLVPLPGACLGQLHFLSEKLSDISRCTEQGSNAWQACAHMKPLAFTAAFACNNLTCHSPIPTQPPPPPRCMRSPCWCLESVS